MTHSYFRALNSSLFMTVPWVMVLYGIIPPISVNAQPVVLQEILSIDGFYTVSDLAVGNDSSIFVALSVRTILREDNALKMNAQIRIFTTTTTSVHCASPPGSSRETPVSGVLRPDR